MRDPYRLLTGALLTWYDKNARQLPWRVPPDRSKAGVLPDAYHVWLSEIMLQQTTVGAVIPYFRMFTHRWRDVHQLAGAAEDDVMAAWAGLGYYARARNLLKCAKVVSRECGGRFPCTPPELRELPGVGPYTAAAIAAIAFGQRAIVVDGNVERVVARLFALSDPLPGAKTAIVTETDRLTPTLRAGDFAQAMMDLGATVCKPRDPDCAVCPVSSSCRALARGEQTLFPLKAPKMPKPTRRGTVFIAIREDGAYLLERRPAKGLLGGMLGWPGGGWSESTAPELASELPPMGADWKPCPGVVKHTFTHFHLELSVQVARVGVGKNPRPGLFFVDAKHFDASDLPTVMRKALTAARPGPARTGSIAPEPVKHGNGQKGTPT